MSPFPTWTLQLLKQRPTAIRLVGLAVAYAFTGWLGLLLAAPPGYATLVWPPSGIAVAALLLFGRKLWPGIWVGSFALNVGVGHALSTSGVYWPVVLSGAVIAMGSAAQALLTAILIGRRFGHPINITRTSDVVLFFVISGPLGCLTAPTVGVMTLWLSGTLPIDLTAATWLSWWSGTMAGVLVILPIALFTPRRRPVVHFRGTPVTPLNASMAIGLFLLMGAILAAWKVTSQIAYDRNLATFSGMAKDSEEALKYRLQSYRQSLDGGAALIASSQNITRQQWVDYIAGIGIGSLPGINGIGYVEPVRRGEEAAFVKRAQADGSPGFFIHPASNRAMRYVIKYIEPIGFNRSAVGLDISFEVNRRNAAADARDSGQATITRRITLVQDKAKTPGFLLLRPVYGRGLPITTMRERRHAFRGWVYAPFIASRFVEGLSPHLGEKFTVDIYDGATTNSDRQIYFGKGVRPRSAYTISRTIPVMGQKWTVVWNSTPQFEKNVGTYEPFIVLFGGIALTLCFGGLLQSYARRQAFINRQVAVKTRSHTEALEALYESERRFADLAGLSPAGIIRTDSYGFCIYVNDSWLALSGLGAPSALGAGWISAIHAEDRASFHAAWMEAINQQGNFRATFRFDHDDGSCRWVDMISQPEMAADGSVRGFVAVAMDVTDRMGMEVALEAARTQAEAAAEAKSSFLANMSHEIRTPMNGVIGFTELLLQSSLSDEQRRQAQLIADSGRSMMRLLNDILDLSKVEAGQMKIAFEPIHLHHVLNSSISLMQALADQKGINLRCEIDATVPAVIGGDGLRIRQILLNLLGNALKFTSNGSVTLRAVLDARTCEQVVIEIEDTGIGIAPDRQAAIFSEFVQADTSIAREHGGTGLGLAISSKLAHLMGGEIMLESQLGVGSVFRVSLPAIAVSDHDRLTLSSQAAGANRRRAPRIPRCGRILLVEDHDINQILMKDMLHRIGMDVTIADNGAKAIVCVEQASKDKGGFDLVLMDMNMPVMNGINATRAIRAAGHDAASLPIVAHTANAFDDDVANCLKAGMQGHLSKPVSMYDLENAIARWCLKSSDLVVRTAVVADSIPATPTLQERYKARKLQTIESVAAFARAGAFDNASLEEVADLLHKLAGTAGMFGEAELGEHARALEAGLKVWPSQDLADRVEQALVALREAA